MAIGAIKITDPIFLHALIIEWFDSVGVYINLKRFTHILEFREWYWIITLSNGVHLDNFMHKGSRLNIDSRTEATRQAIIQANKIYNEKNN